MIETYVDRDKITSRVVLEIVQKLLLACNGYCRREVVVEKLGSLLPSLDRSKRLERGKERQCEGAILVISMKSVCGKNERTLFGRPMSMKLCLGQICR
jgi:hypothetical protein